MKLKFKTQAYQSAAVQAVVDCFEGQPKASAESLSYRSSQAGVDAASLFSGSGFKNADLVLTDAQMLENIRRVQRRQNLPLSDRMVKTAASRVNLDVEMETGTGKTYCYIKTIFDLNLRYGWSKFIIVVPSIAIREGVAKSLEITAEHFLEIYRKKARFFIYNSKQLHLLEGFSSDAGINVMVINVQAFNAKGKDNLRIYDELDDFQSRRPIDVISANRPIVILDEPQKMEGAKTLASLAEFNALAVLRYSATHKTTHNKIHRLDALDAYSQKLVKRIAVRGISVRGLAGTAGYLYLQSIEISSENSPRARIEFEIKRKNAEPGRVTRTLSKGADLFELSGGLEQYRVGYVISDVDARFDCISFVNGLELTAGDATGDVSEAALRRVQIREAIKAHLEKERALFIQGIKVLTLFFIDEVAKYRDYGDEDQKGDYARIFEEEYREQLDAMLTESETPYSGYLKDAPVQAVHSGYFSIDKKTRRWTDSAVAARGENAGLSDDVDAYDLILKDKETLLSFPVPSDDAATRARKAVRFIFTHSALREGWDNPNVFVICTLKHSDNTISRRQEVGRGLRLSVNQHGDRMDDPSTVHDVNVLTVVASESYKTFVAALQSDIAESLSARPRVANEAFFIGKVMRSATGDVVVSPQLARQIYKYLLKHDYTDVEDHITEAYHSARAAGTLAELPPELQTHATQILELVDSVFSTKQLPAIDDGRRQKRNPLNSNFHREEFKALWDRINRKAAYSVAFNDAELVRKAVAALNEEGALRVAPMSYTVQRGEQATEITYDGIKGGTAFSLNATETEIESRSAHSQVKYDLIGKLTEDTLLTRSAIADILRHLTAGALAKFRANPEGFIAEAARIINEQKAGEIIEHLAYDPIDEKFDLDIFTASQAAPDFSRFSAKLHRHIYDYASTDSEVERQFVKELDTSSEVVVYAKLPRGFLIPTPVGDYNPDWAISFKAGSVKHVYFVAETKGSLSSLELRRIEETKIACARKFFADMTRRFAPEQVKYEVVDSFARLMDVVK